jgi:exodeoxyribonuclease III
MLRLISLNLNGIRSAANKGFVAWAEKVNIDFMAVQELKAQADDIAKVGLDSVAGMPGYFQCAEKKGYSGVGLYSRHEPSDVVIGFDSHHGGEFDAEGRWVELRYDTPEKKFSVISSYFPSGSSGDDRQAAKFRFLGLMYPHLQALKKQREFVLMGDVNIAHQEIDLKNWKGNLKNSGFTPEERAWMSKLLGEAGLVDVFRTLNPHPEQYTWWSQRGAARAKNVGWRIDYHLATPGVAATAMREHIYTAENFSDHAPLVIDYDWGL